MSLLLPALLFSALLCFTLYLLPFSSRVKVMDKGAKRLLQYTLSPYKKRTELTMKRLCAQQFIDNTGAVTATRYCALLCSSLIVDDELSRRAEYN